MPRRVVCPFCDADMCSSCTGAGCFCDCQLPDFANSYLVPPHAEFPHEIEELMGEDDFSACGE
jgi:hypothetical protein